ncbi:MAG: formyltetrahydrofolate deformylase [Cytophagales bacterium]|nr:MAG: formyltetrahydrofolate deformylase [Cytophagales bacterium]
MLPSVTLLIDCPDQKGLVYQITSFIFHHQGNILSIDQYVDEATQWFFMRVKWDLQHSDIPPAHIAEVFDKEIAQQYQIRFKIFFSEYKPKMAIFVSKAAHCLYDLLSKVYSKDFWVDVPCIISNHEDLRTIADDFGIAFHHLPIDASNKNAQEEITLNLMKQYEVDFIVLARYMQVLSDSFVSHFPNNVINIHHSFLPAFAGAKPYHAAFERGVKIIGATGHYVTADLDEGPIIEQDVIRIEQGDSIKDFIRKGQDMEKAVLSRSVYLHLQHQTLVRNNKTVVFKA